MNAPDLNALTLVQVLTLAVVLAAFDLVAAVVSSLVTHTFDPAKLPNFLVDHVLARIFPIGALAVIGAGGPYIGLPLIPPMFALALAGLAAYLVATVASISASLPLSSPIASFPATEPSNVTTGPVTPIPPGA